MNKYELGVVVRADLEEENFQAEMTRVKGLIERFDGTIDKVDEWGRRKLAYPIQKLTEGMYTFITFTSPAGTPREVESRLRLMENVLRFLIVRKDEAESAAPAAAKPVMEAEAEAPVEVAVEAEVEAVEEPIEVEAVEEPVEVEVVEEPVEVSAEEEVAADVEAVEESAEAEVDEEPTAE